MQDTPDRASSADAVIPEAKHASPRGKIVRSMGGSAFFALATIMLLAIVAQPSPRAAQSATPAGSGELLHIRERGALPGGVFDNAAKFAALPAGHYLVSGGRYRIASSIRIARGVVLDILPGASLAPDAGATVTLAGAVEDKVHTQIFTGAGRVVGMIFNRPEWWNVCPATYGDTCDSAPAINAAIASMEASFSPRNPLNPSDGGSRPTVQLGCSRFYMIKSPVDLHPSGTMSEQLQGCGNVSNGGWLVAGPSFRGAGAVLVHGYPPAAGATQDFVLRDLHVQNGTGGSAPVGVYFNPEGEKNYISGVYSLSLVDNVTVYNFPIDWNIVNTLGVKFSRTAAIGWAATGAKTIGYNLTTAGTGAAASTGELYFDNFIVNVCNGHVGPNCTGMALSTDASAATGAPGVAAIEVHGIFEQSNLTMNASGGGAILDVWVKPGTQFDGYGCDWIFARSTGIYKGASPRASQIGDVHVDHVYHTGTNAGCVSHTWQADSGGIMTGVFDTNNWFIGQAGKVIDVFGVNGASVDGNIIEASGLSGLSCAGAGCVATTQVPAIEVHGQSAAVGVENNKCSGISASSSFANYAGLVQLDRDTNYVSVGGNIGINCGVNLNNNSDGKNNLVGTH